jgi:hypothetical protein
MNYGELKAQFAGLLNRRDLTSSLQTTFVQQGIAKVQRQLRVPAMEKVVAVVIGPATYAVAPSIGLPIPSDLIQLIAISVYDATGVFQGTLDGVDIETCKLTAITTGAIPRVYAREGGSWVFGPTPATGMTIRIHYYTEIGAMVADADSTTMSEVCPEVFIYAALGFAGDYFMDARTQGWKQTSADLMSELANQADRDELAARKVVQPAYAFPSDD